MKKHIITFISILTMIATPVLAGTWVAQSSYGPTCYLVKSGTQGLIGTGIVKTNSGTITFTGYLKAMSNPHAGFDSSMNFGTNYIGNGYGYGYNYSLFYDCSNAGASQFSCAIHFAQNAVNWTSVAGSATYNDVSHPTATVYVSGAAVDSARPVACW